MIPEPIRALLDRLACPRCGGALRERDDAVACESCGAIYPVTDGVLDFLSPTSHTDREDP